MATLNSHIPQGQRGAGMVEVLVTLVIVAVGLFGLLGLQSRVQVTEVESYQRTQAQVLLNDMASRIATNRNAAADYVTGTATPLGAGMTCDVPAAGAERSELDLSEWCFALQGAAELVGGARGGAMIGGRGCIESLPNGEYLVTVAWQGLTPITAPSAGLACGQDDYDDPTPGAACTADRCRRAISTLVRVADLG